MVSEVVCLDILRMLLGRTSTMTQTYDLDTDKPIVKKSDELHALPDSSLVRPLLLKYDIAEIDTAIRWLQLGEYLGRTQWGIQGPWVHKLTEKGVIAATSGGFSEDERRLFYLVEPHQVFLAHQFRPEDAELEAAIRKDFAAAGFSVVDGKVDGLEEFRHAILAKIRKSRFFLCLLTHRSKLAVGSYASSVWLYQEIGAAVALGKSPLLLVQDGMDSHYAGELQKTYEYIGFSPDGFKTALPEVIRRFQVELERHHLPLPSGVG